jgi:hypothetical protein
MPRLQAEDDAIGGRIQQGVLDYRGRALDHRRGCGRDASIPVSPKERTCLHPLGQSGLGFIARAIRRWLEASEVRTLYIELGSP